MHEISKSLYEANRLFRTADHLAYVTYPLVKDNKLIGAMTENLTEAMIKAMDALLYYDKENKRINYIPEDFLSRLEVFKSSCAPRYNINLNYLSLMKNLKDLQDLRKKSKLEFIRKENYVITANNFNVKMLNYQKIKDYINLSKQFFTKINFILQHVKT